MISSKAYADFCRQEERDADEAEREKEIAFEVECVRADVACGRPLAELLPLVPAWCREQVREEVENG